MRLSIESRKFESFTSHSLVINGVPTNQWAREKSIIENFIKAINKDSNLKKLVAKCFKENRENFNYCDFISMSNFLNLPVKIYYFDNVSSYLDFKKKTYGHWSENRSHELFSISGSSTKNKTFDETFVKNTLKNHQSSQLCHLYSNSGHRAKELHLVVFNFGYHFSTYFDQYDKSILN